MVRERPRNKYGEGEGGGDSDRRGILQRGKEREEWYRKHGKEEEGKLRVKEGNSKEKGRRVKGNKRRGKVEEEIHHFCT